MSGRLGAVIVAIGVMRVIASVQVTVLEIAMGTLLVALAAFGMAAVALKRTSEIQKQHAERIGQLEDVAGD